MSTAAQTTLHNAFQRQYRWISDIVSSPNHTSKCKSAEKIMGTRSGSITKPKKGQRTNQQPETIINRLTAPLSHERLWGLFYQDRWEADTRKQKKQKTMSENARKKPMAIMKWFTEQHKKTKSPTTRKIKEGQGYHIQQNSFFLFSFRHISSLCAVQQKEGLSPIWLHNRKRKSQCSSLSTMSK